MKKIFIFLTFSIILTSCSPDPVSNVTFVTNNYYNTPSKKMGLHIHYPVISNDSIAD